MANVAEDNWRAFRRYWYRGITIEQYADRIHFSQRNSVYRKGMRYTLIGLGVLCVGPAAIMMMRGAQWAVTGLLYLIASGTVSLIIALLAYLLFRRRTKLDIYRGYITIDDGNDAFQIPVQEIKGVDVRNGDTGMHEVHVWHGPVAITTLNRESHEDAIALKEGIVAAIGVMNQEGSSVTPKRARTFDE